MDRELHLRARVCRRLPACLFVLGLATTARASPTESVDRPSRAAEQQLGELQLQLLPRRDLAAEVVEDEPADPYYRVVGFAQLTGGGRGQGDVGVGAAAALAGVGCDALAGTVHGRLGSFDEGGRAAGEVTYAACLSEKLITLRFDGRRGSGGVPGLAARRSLWSRRYDSTYDRITFAVGEYESDNDRSHRHTLSSVRLGHGTTTQHDGHAQRTIKELDLEFTLYRYRHTAGLELGVITLDVAAKKADDDLHGGVASAFLPLRMRYDTPMMYVAARGGWGRTGGNFAASGSMSTQVNGQTVSSSSWRDTIDGEGLPEMTALVGDVEAGVRHGRMQASVRLARAFYPTFDGNVAREARVSGALTYQVGETRRTQLTLSPFAVRTRTWTRGAGSPGEVSAGASIHVGHAFGHRRTALGLHQLRVDAIGEAGLSPYTRLDGERLPASTLGGQLLVAVSGSVAR